MEHNYPGNVRELENVVERILILAHCGPLKPEEVRSFFEKPPAKPTTLNGATAGAGSEQVMLKWPLPPQGMNLEQEIQNLEKSFILQALQKEQGKKGKASALLGLSGRSFRYKVKKYGIHLKTTNPASRDRGET